MLPWRQARRLCLATAYLALCAVAQSQRSPTTVTPTSPSTSLTVGRIQLDRGNVYSEIAEVDKAFTFRTNNVQLRLTPQTFECLSKFKFDGTLTVNAVTSGDTNQWILWKLDTFNPNVVSAWMPGHLSTCGRSGDFFLGGPCKLSKGRVNRFYVGIPTHSEIRVTGRVHFFDQWNGKVSYGTHYVDAGETLSLKVDDATVWSQSYNWCPTVGDAECVKYGIDSCGQEYPDRLSVYYDVSLPHSAGSVALELTSTLDTDPCEASWGVDDVAVYIR
ncbi:uncharacterized protein BcabD6B2_20960 [Babesia caballi]|uniref:Membrane protein, putative n=1 Tax=Babesia caballi TaxID=5871 RepID=A0AAV4LS58_BABCB|nr:membrane protein, putative [Babesia caballi]